VGDLAQRSPVALAREGTRYESVLAALESVSAWVGLGDARCVLIKPNCVSVSHQLAATHMDAIRAVLDFVRARYGGRIVIAEGAALSPTWEGFHGFGYDALAEAYGAELVDLNADEAVAVQVYDRRLRPIRVYLARTAVEADYRISVSPPKTHDCVIVTLSIKNIAMGALINPQAVRRGGGAPGLIRWAGCLVPRWVRQSPLAEWAKGSLLGPPNGSSKMAMHQGLRAMNLNLALVASRVWPHMAVIDGWQGMEGDGPGSGDAVDWRVALAGTDALAVDVLATHLMGFAPERVGYLQYCGQLGLGVGSLEQIDTVGNLALDEARRIFEPHPTYKRQLQWQLDGAEKYLGVGTG
jgi:uncharacterized protein (DUF362 family)